MLNLLVEILDGEFVVFEGRGSLGVFGTEFVDLFLLGLVEGSYSQDLLLFTC